MKYLVSFGILLIPAGYELKSILNVDHWLWINPSLIIGLISFALLGFKASPKITVVPAIVVIPSTLAGFIFIQDSGLYDTVREPARFILCFTWFWATVWLVKQDSLLAAQSIALSCTIQLVFAAFLWLSWAQIIPQFGLLDGYIESQSGRQLVWFGDSPIQRLKGSFFEGPPFGLFMLCSFIVLHISIVSLRYRTKIIYTGLFSSFVGIVGSLSDQIYLALISYVFLASLASLSSRTLRTTVPVLVILIAFMVPFLSERLTEKLNQGGTNVENVLGTSGGERIFHTRSAINIAMASSQHLLFGIGPGRYGEYAMRAFDFPKNVTPQVMPVEWLVGYGLIGLLCLLSLMMVFAFYAWTSLGFLGLAASASLILANLFQANWLWEAWFLAWSFLCFSGHKPESVCGQNAIHT